MRAEQNFIPVKQKATMGLALIKEAMLDHLEANKEGLRNADLARDLGLECEHPVRAAGWATSAGSGAALFRRLVDRR